MDMEADTKVPIILGRPFLCTAKAIINVYEGKLTLGVGDESVCLKIANSVSTGGELMNHDVGVNEVMRGEPWDVFNHFDARKMDLRHQVCILYLRIDFRCLGRKRELKIWLRHENARNSLEIGPRRVTRHPRSILSRYVRHLVNYAGQPPVAIRDGQLENCRGTRRDRECLKMFKNPGFQILPPISFHTSCSLPYEAI
ncbi:hypothetical protein E3N88_12290 [Mikania micrantha]|uniref:Uncharacterized protein n=1 Tax=Mikania micrantha TaxID=192012 RepID=A0A5N6P6V9_9ASTR|nr:hypothetical protein E3N88_12290 [Mikania micrantha]